MSASLDPNASAAPAAPHPPLPRPPLARAAALRWHYRPALIARGGNRVEAPARAAWLRLFTVLYGGSTDNLVRAGRNFRSGGLVIRIAGAGNRIEIGDDVRLSGRISLRGFGLTVRIGDRCDIKRARMTVCDAGLSIGADCLTGAGLAIRTSDMHVVTDRASGAVLNGARAVSVGDGVWLAGEVALLKGSRVPDGCVVGFRSVVTRAFDEPDCVIAGAPARIVRRGIAWRR